MSKVTKQTEKHTMMSVSDRDWIPNSSKEWLSWLTAQEDKTVQVYLTDPDRLISDYRKERQISKDYQGREILELLQNANDAAAEKGIKGKVLIELNKEGLLMANTGLPFSTGGVSSFRMTDLSPKRLNKNNLIGQKGLGFRAVLNWTKQPIILSGALSLTYSNTKLKECVDKLNPHSRSKCNSSDFSWGFVAQAFPWSVVDS